MSRSFFLTKVFHNQLLRTLNQVPPRFLFLSTETSKKKRKVAISTDIMPTGKVGEKTKLRTWSSEGLVSRIVKEFAVLKKEAEKMIDHNQTLLEVPVKEMKKKLSTLSEHKVSASTLMKYSWILEVPSEKLDEQVKLIKSMNVDINEFIPLLRASPRSLTRLIKFQPEETKSRVFYFSKMLEVEPSTIAHLFANRLFMFRLSCEQIKDVLDLMIEFKIAPKNILQDLWAFKYPPNVVRSRLEQCRQSGKVNLKPWVIRCPEETLLNSLHLTRGKHELLTNDSKNIDYLAMRLEIDVESATKISKDKRLLTARVQKLKEVLDYLLENFEASEVVRNPRILCNSLKTIKNRIEEMRMASNAPIKLYIITKSKVVYEENVRARAKKFQTKMILS